MKQLEKNSKEVIRVQTKTFKGQPYIDIRTWVKSFDEKEYFPTKKGVTFQPEKLPELKDMLEELQPLEEVIESN